MWNRMDRIDRLHPVTLLSYFLCVMGIAMFSMNPGIQVISLFGAAVFGPLHGREAGRRKRSFLPLFFLLVFLVNPLFYHNGKTVLFYLNGNRITLEAVIYGFVTALMLSGILLWCKSLSKIMDSERIVYLFGRISPKAALICSMVLRFVPMFRRQMGKTRESQKLLGLYGEETLLERLKGEMYVFSAMITWSFEHSMDTADSMQARGYGTGKRSMYTEYRMKKADVILLSLMLLFTAAVLFAVASGVLDTVYYPGLILPGNPAAEALAWGAYFGLCQLLPAYVLIGRLRRSVK